MLEKIYFQLKPECKKRCESQLVQYLFIVVERVWLQTRARNGTIIGVINLTSRASSDTMIRLTTRQRRKTT